MAVNRIKGAFAVPRKGETFELRAGLVSQYAYERKEAIQKTIMSMTLGKDVSALFPDVLKNIATADLDQKKLVYLYLIQELNKQYLKKMAPPLVTLVASAPEVQYVALRNIDLLLQSKPDILSKELRVFFCKYNDPPYVKLQKLEIMVRIANDKNVDQLLAELKEYALEVDMDFVRRAVKAIGQAAIKIESASEKCVNTLLDLIATKVNYVVQEAIVVIKDIFRKYPGYEGIIPTLCKHIDELDEPEARGALIWIVGEYAEKISNADEILAGFVEGFMEEFTQVQLQILTAVVKLFLKKPDNNQGLVQTVLQSATADNDNPDIRDRAYVYWRLLSGDLQIAKNIILSEKPPITTTMSSLPPALLEQLLTELSTLASVYHKPPETFVGHGRYGADAIQHAAIQEQRQNAVDNPIAAAGVVAKQNGQNAENLLDIDFDGGAPASADALPSGGASGLEGLAGTPQRVASPPSQQPANNMDDMMGLFDMNGSSSNPAPQGNDMNDLMGGLAGMDMSLNHQPPPPQQQLGEQGKKTNEDLLGMF
ncbi:putative AP-1 complex subunit beta-1 [Glarea lozoyensis 74030]|uniref:AP complex subunit beta n=1 Tax=Glarea lozoyensis (strain ATCC 74030 / MF5533) TaxID=1104152 RepID=H0EUJ8_GLAL7|nr:putative AP-1 complex subunit beta-1 [Glarea lozoyensis 74030]